MKRIFLIKLTLLSLVLVGAFLLNSDIAFAQANIVVVNQDGPNEGFNDPTPAAPVGGNMGTTLGQQRLIAFQRAADIWGAKLSSNATIYIQAAFNPLTCTPTAATLGAAGAIQIFANFPGREFDNTWYHVALANKLAGADLAPGPNGTTADDIVATFNSSLNGNPACLGGRKFYLGLDNNHGTDIDLIAVLLHEFGHGLGFANFVNETTGTTPLGLGDIFGQYTFDRVAGKKWNQMTTNAERQASAINTNQIVWDGINVKSEAPNVLSPGVIPSLTIIAPNSIADNYRVGTAAFGPDITSTTVSGNVVQALDPADGAGPLTTDACSALTNAAAVAGNIALVDRGTCGFVVKVKNAQDAGAIGVIVADNVAGGPPAGMAGVDPTIVIPSVRVMIQDGNRIKAELANGVNVRMGIDSSVLAGADKEGRTKLFAPNPVQQGSSISHWDTIAFRNQLMEPAINADLTHSVMAPEDLTLKQMVDIGWFSDGDGVPDGEDECIGSSPSPTVVIGGCDSGVPNTVFPNGCKISDRISQIAAGSSNHGVFASRVARFLSELVRQGVITDAQKDAIQSCAARASIP
jgi:hypothetical protein